MKLIKNYINEQQNLSLVRFTSEQLYEIESLITNKLGLFLLELIFFIRPTSPRGPILGARDEVAPTSPPTTLKYTVK